MSQWQQYPQYGQQQQQQQQWPMQYQPPPAPLKHSGFGIASFIISIAAVIFAFGMVVLAGVMESRTPGGIDEESPEAMAVGLGIILSGLLAVLGGVLGIVGCSLPNRNKVFAILGTIFNALVVLGLVGLMILGLAAG